MSAPKKFSQEQRAALVALLERFNLSVESFDALRSDAYEQSLARHSLEHLELLYAELLKPGQPLDQAQENCPPWPAGTKLAGRQPSIGTLSEISQRLRAEATLNDLGVVSRFMDKIRNRATSLPVGQQTEVLDTLVNLVGEELISSKMKGKALTDNLPVLDRLLIADSNKTRARQEEKKIELKERAEKRAASKLGLDERKIILLEKKAAAYDRAQAALDAAKKSKGGITPETLKRIETELKLL
jgi:hypothetical protein